MPFLRLTRDRRGFENTYLMHADRPGDRPRILYWYRTAPGIVQGRAPLDEDAIRTIEDQHPHIEFDWPAILAMSEMMTPEDEAPPPRPQQSGSGPGRRKSREPRRDGRERKPSAGVEQVSDDAADGAPPNEPSEAADVVSVVDPIEPAEVAEPRNRLVEELAGREIAARLRARHAEIISRIESLDIDGAEKDALFRRAEAIDPELWMTPESVLEGIRGADTVFEQLRASLAQPPRE